MSPTFDRLKTASLEPEERWASVCGGKLRYVVQGSGPPVILLHGIVASSFSFRLIAPQLSQEFRLYLPDLRVAGADASLRATATRILELLDQAAIESACILGSSHGGAVAIELSAMAPERIRRLILVSPANPFARSYQRVVKFYLSRPGAVFIRLAPFAPIPFWDYGMRRMCGRASRLAPDVGVGYRQPLRERGMTSHIRSSLQTFNAEIEALRPKLSSLRKMPILLVWGDCDPVVELDSGRQLQQALGAKMVVMRGIGHLPYEESPEKFSQIVLEFLKNRMIG